MMVKPCQARFAACLLAVAAPILFGSAAAQSITINRNGADELNAINSGDVSLRGNVTNAAVLGGTNNSAGNLTAQGASSSYSINDANLNAQGEAVGTYTASVSGVNANGTNSGSVDVRATITGGTLAANNTGQSVSATGHSNVISIRTTSK